MNRTLINQLKAKHETAKACLTIIENATDADMKNKCAEWYESFVNDINEMQVPEEEKAQYFDLDMESHNDAIDNVLASTIFAPGTPVPFTYKSYKY